MLKKLKELCISFFEDDFFYYYYSETRSILRIEKKNIFFKNSKKFIKVLDFLPVKKELRGVSPNSITDYWVLDYFFNISFLKDYIIEIEDSGLNSLKIPYSYLKYSTYGIEIDKTVSGSMNISFPSEMSFYAYELFTEYLEYTNSSFDIRFFENLNDKIDVCALFFKKNKLNFKFNEKDYESIIGIHVRLQNTSWFSN